MPPPSGRTAQTEILRPSDIIIRYPRHKSLQSYRTRMSVGLFAAGQIKSCGVVTDSSASNDYSNAARRRRNLSRMRGDRWLEAATRAQVRVNLSARPPDLLALIVSLSLHAKSECQLEGLRSRDSETPVASTTYPSPRNRGDFVKTTRQAVRSRCFRRHRSPSRDTRLFVSVLGRPFVKRFALC